MGCAQVPGAELGQHGCGVASAGETPWRPSTPGAGGAGHLGTLCLAGTQVPDSPKESRLSASTILSVQTVQAQEKGGTPVSSPTPPRGDRGSPQRRPVAHIFPSVLTPPAWRQPRIPVTLGCEVVPLRAVSSEGVQRPPLFWSRPPHLPGVPVGVSRWSRCPALCLLGLFHLWVSAE